MGFIALPATLEDTTVQNVKDYFNYADTNRDGTIAIVMPMAADIIYRYCRTKFKQITGTFSPIIEAVQNIFYTPLYPIAAPATPPTTVLLTVTENGNLLAYGTDYFVDLEIGRFRRLSAPHDSYYDRVYNYGLYWSTQPGGIVVSYTAGKTLPADVLLVFYELAGIYSQINQKVFTDIEGRELATKYDAIPAELKHILDRHVLTSRSML